MTFPLIQYLPSIAPASMIFDIGCDRLSLSAPILRDAFPEAIIHAFDPEPRHIKALAETGDDRRLNIYFHPVAVCDRSGGRDFWQSQPLPGEGDSWFMSGSIREPVIKGDGTHYKSNPISVHTVTLDDFCQVHVIDAIDLICLDVQGSEDLVLRGASRMLPRIRYVYAEHNAGANYEGEPGFDGIARLLPGWELVEMWEFDALWRNLSL